MTIDKGILRIAQEPWSKFTGDKDFDRVCSVEADKENRYSAFHLLEDPNAAAPDQGKKGPVFL